MILDDGYQFGLGAFETIAINDGALMFLDRHLDRMANTLEFLKIENRVTKQEIAEYLKDNQLTEGGLKIMVSQKNTIFSHRDNPYKSESYEKGAVMDFGGFRRNETSPLICHKTLNYGECILENRNAKARGLDEIIFLNTKGEICEGTVSNIFFVKEGTIYTPAKSCGLLPGVVRDFVLEHGPAIETVIRPEDVESYDECFITNSLMGIMPVRRLENKTFHDRTMTATIIGKYQGEITKQKRMNATSTM